MDRDAARKDLEALFRSVMNSPGVEVTDDLSAEQVENWDSLNHLNFMVAVEQRFGVKFTSREMRETSRIGTLLDLIASKKSP